MPFVQATVVRAQEPTRRTPATGRSSWRTASIEGFVGGHCAAGSVRTAALGTLGSGESLLLRVLPDGEDAFPETPGASMVVNPCLSGGALEIYLEPLLPSPLLHLVGTSPTAEAVAASRAGLGFVVDRAAEGADPTGATAVVISSHGGDEAGEIRAALDAGVGFVGVVCSRTRGEALLDELGLTDDEAAPGARRTSASTSAPAPRPEIALSILAAVVRSIRLDGLVAARGPSSRRRRPRQAVDPVCGMTVTIGPDAVHAS